MKKFTCIITNPPYNCPRETSKPSNDIYPKFIEKALQLSDRYVIMITKSTWMNKSSLSEFKHKMICEFGVNKINHYNDNPFLGTDISGGVSYFVIDKKNIEETFLLNNNPFNRAESNQILPYKLNNKEVNLFRKINNFKKLNLSNYNSKGNLGIATNDKRLLSESRGNDIECHVSKQKGFIKYFPEELITEKIKSMLKKLKIFITATDGGNSFSLGRVFKSEENQISNDSFIFLTFDNLLTREKFYQYMNTKLFRVVVSFIKTGRHISINTFSLVPEIDLNRMEVVNDENVYKYLNLTQEDIEIIEERSRRLKLLK
jgi:hypothetical protein